MIPTRKKSAAKFLRRVFKSCMNHLLCLAKNLVRVLPMKTQLSRSFCLTRIFIKQICRSEIHFPTVGFSIFKKVFVQEDLLNQKIF